MSLPTIPVPTFELVLPSSGQAIKFRPFLTGEHKLLMIAIETGEGNDVDLAIEQIIDRCLFGKVEVSKLPSIDMEYIFLKLRSKSIGEVIELDVECQSCKGVNDYSLDISKIEPTGTVVNKVELDDNFGMILRLPTAAESTLLANNMTVENVYNVLVSCIEQIYMGDEVYLAKDYTAEELDGWMEKLTTPHFEKLEAFFRSIPKLKTNIKFKCKHCEAENDIAVEGIASFFG